MDGTTPQIEVLRIGPDPMGRFEPTVFYRDYSIDGGKDVFYLWLDHWAKHHPGVSPDAPEASYAATRAIEPRPVPAPPLPSTRTRDRDEQMLSLGFADPEDVPLDVYLVKSGIAEDSLVAADLSFVVEFLGLPPDSLRLLAKFLHRYARRLEEDS